MAELNVAFWNLQNLFDATASEIAADLEFTPAEGWTEEAVEKKLASLAEIIRLMFDGAGPDLLGVCEIETRELAERLMAAVGRDDWVLAHDPSPDVRGIACSLYYSQEKFELAGPPIGHLVHLRFATRDIFEVPLRVRSNGAELRVFVNHWPSRRQGTEQSEAFRITVASHAGRLVDRALKLERDEFLALDDSAASRRTLEERWSKSVLLMGDLNDDPFDRSVLEVLRASNSQDWLEEELLGRNQNLPREPADYLRKQAALWNYSWPLVGQEGVGSIFYARGNPRTKQVFDQLIGSRGLFYGLDGLRLDPASAAIFSPKRMWTDSRLPDDALERLPHRVRPRPFDKRRHRGFSDHFPVIARLEAL
jgi:hypothetical protein